MAKTTTICLPASRFADADDSLAAAAAFAVEAFPDLAGWDMDARFADDEREAILLDVPDPQTETDPSTLPGGANYMSMFPTGLPVAGSAERALRLVLLGERA